MRKKITTVTLLIMSLAIFGSWLYAQETSGKSLKKAGDLTLVVTDIKNKRGHIIISIYDESSEFNRSGVKTHSLLSIKATESKVRVTLSNFPKGRYAISVLHDENNNGAMDFDKNSVPKEAYAYSKNVGELSVPVFADAAFKHHANTTIAMALISPF